MTHHNQTKELTTWFLRKGGGLALFWSDEIKIQVLSYGLHHIDTLICGEGHLFMANPERMTELRCGSCYDD
jgi:hypothetical protein